jgi:BASS family bile acid:Na+ symporter
MVILIVGGVTAANAELIRASADSRCRVGAGALALNLAGYALGWSATGLGWSVTRVRGALTRLGGSATKLGDSATEAVPRPARIAGTLSVGMRDFAVAAALVTAAGFPTSASLPAVLFGIVEMATSAFLARRFAG